MTGVYQASVEEYRNTAAKRLRDAQKAYKSIAHKESSYAREIFALIKLHRQIVKIWTDAPAELNPTPEIKPIEYL